jgi:hypothetical protein
MPTFGPLECIICLVVLVPIVVVVVIVMLLNKSKTVSSEFNKALEQYKSLPYLDDDGYRRALYQIVLHCQNALNSRSNDGDSLVLLSNAYFLISMYVKPGEYDHDMLLRAARLITHWTNTHPISSAEAAINGKKLFSSISEKLSGVLSKTPEQAMSYVSLLPPGQLNDALKDRLSVGMLLYPERFKQMGLG